MNSASFVPIFVLFLVIFIMARNEKMIMQKLIKKRKSEGKVEMLELAKRFIEKECIIYTFNNQYTGTIKEVSDGAMLIENNGNVEVINLDFVVRIKEYPRKKNGKKKSVVLD